MHRMQRSDESDYYRLTVQNSLSSASSSSSNYRSCKCTSCREYLIEDAVMARIDALLVRADSTAELEVLRYAA